MRELCMILYNGCIGRDFEVRDFCLTPKKKFPEKVILYICSEMNFW